jgi:hypothetical protein
MYGCKALHLTFFGEIEVRDDPQDPFHMVTHEQAHRRTGEVLALDFEQTIDMLDDNTPDRKYRGVATLIRASTRSTSRRTPEGRGFGLSPALALHPDSHKRRVLYHSRTASACA